MHVEIKRNLRLFKVLLTRYYRTLLAKKIGIRHKSLNGKRNTLTFILTNIHLQNIKNSFMTMHLILLLNSQVLKKSLMIWKKVGFNYMESLTRLLLKSQKRLVENFIK